MYHQTIAGHLRGAQQILRLLKGALVLHFCTCCVRLHKSYDAHCGENACRVGLMVIYSYGREKSQGKGAKGQRLLFNSNTLASHNARGRSPLVRAGYSREAAAFRCVRFTVRTRDLGHPVCSDPESFSSEQAVLWSRSAFTEQAFSLSQPVNRVDWSVLERQLQNCEKCQASSEGIRCVIVKGGITYAKKRSPGPSRVRKSFTHTCSIREGRFTCSSDCTEKIGILPDRIAGAGKRLRTTKQKPF